MRKNSIKKGHRFELDVVKLLNNYTDDKYKFFRTPGSGAFATSHQLINYAGDIQTENREFKYSIECKFYKKFSFQDIIKLKESLVEMWWEQARKESARVNKIPILIFKLNNDKVYCMFDINLITLEETFKKYIIYDGKIITLLNKEIFNKILNDGAISKWSKEQVIQDMTPNTE